MTSNEVRKKYIEFFEKKKHKVIPAAPLILQDDPTTLFNSSGMQQLVPYLMGKKHPLGKRLVDVQPSFRMVDIEEIGDNRHLTYFEMLGNWSLGDYFKKEQLSWFWEFLTKELNLDEKRLWVTVFEGDDNVSKDEESYKIWKKLGVPEERIHFYGVDKNWWSRSGTPEQMPVGEIGGPDSEVFFEFTQIKHDSRFGKKCHPNCDCGRFLEIGNSVFIQYKKTKNGKLKELPQKSVDFGGGLERLIAAVQDIPDIFKSDIFEDKIKKIEKTSGISYGKDKKTDENIRIIVDHIRAAEALISGGTVPGNKMQGYVLRRLIRRSALKLRLMKGSLESGDLVLVEGKAGSVIKEEIVKFRNTLNKGLKEVEKVQKIDGKRAFDLYQTYGFPLEMTKEIFEEKGQKINQEVFEEEFEKHKDISRSSSKGKFKGGLADSSKETVKLHTATHLLHWALRSVLGEGVKQEGSNITAERLRFDFSHDKKLSEEELKEVERLINKAIKDTLPVHKTVESKDDALKGGALSFFRETYPEEVSVYTIGKDSKKDWISKEFCGGPHVKNTSELGRVRIKKQEKIGSNLVRVYAYLD